MYPAVLFEDNHLLIVNKPCGVLVQPDKSLDAENLEEQMKLYIKEKYNKPGAVFLGVPHRIDRPTSGVVVLCKTSKALERMNELFKQKEITKTYWAVVKKNQILPEDKLVHYIARDQKNNVSRVTDFEVPTSQRAELTYETITELDNFLALEVNLITGRHHQIRAQLSKIGCPIKGDLKYGAPRSNPGGGIHLHARSISFVHPVTKETLHVVAPPPEQDAIWKAVLEKSK